MPVSWGRLPPCPSWTGWSWRQSAASRRGLAHNALASLKKQGFAEFVKHGSALISTTRRYYVTAVGVKRLAADGNTTQREVLRAYCVSAQWQRLLLERLDAVAVIYRLASAMAAVTGSLSVLWYRNGPLDCIICLSDGRTVGVVRRGSYRR